MGSTDTPTENSMIIEILNLEKIQIRGNIQIDLDVCERNMLDT